MNKKVCTYLAMSTGWFAAMLLGLPGLALAEEDSPTTSVTHHKRIWRASRPPLLQACSKCRTEEVQALLTAGADPNVADDIGRTGLHHAVYWACGSAAVSARSERVKLVELLLAADADPSRKNMWGQTALHRAANSRGSDVKKVIELLLAAGADIRARDNYGYTPLHHAGEGRSAEAAKVLLERGADVNAKAEGGSTALIHTAAVIVNFFVCPTCDQTSPELLEVVKVLLEAGADINARTDKGMTALGWAQKTGKTGVVELLKAQGAKE